MKPRLWSGHGSLSNCPRIKDDEESVVDIVEPFVLEERGYVCLRFLDENCFLMSMIPFRGSRDACFGIAYR
jgi:hypothetical protein